MASVSSTRIAAERVVIVGGGVVGLWAARHLHRAGVQVTVLERDRVGSGASRGNGGEVCPAFSVPLPAPGVIGPSLRTLLRRDSALYVRPHASLELARFLLGFAWNARPSRFARGLHALGELSGDAAAQYRELEADGLRLGLDDHPYLRVFPSAAAAEHSRRELERTVGDRFQVPDAVLDREQMQALEPCLTGPLAGYQVDGQLTLDPAALIEALAARLRADGVEIREGVRVTAVESTASSATVHATDARHHADAAVLACGVWSSALARTLGARLPIFPGKGYSFSVAIDERPRHPMALEAAHVVTTPIAGTTRVAGTMEFDSRHDRFDQRRIEAIVAAASRYLRGAHWGQRSAEWMGPRPMTPTGLPLIGRLPGAGPVFVAAGHNMLGVTLAPGTGRVLAELITTGVTETDLAPFAPPAAR